MKREVAAIAIATALLTAGISTPSYATQCVAYVKSVTRIDLRGDAWKWWDSASGEYSRGHKPHIGAIMVFDRTKKMRSGHVAVVVDLVSDREVLIDHANWAAGKKQKGKVSTAVSVVDVSEKNDWTKVRVRWEHSADYGRDNPVRGFIYSTPESRG